MAARFNPPPGWPPTPPGWTPPPGWQPDPSWPPPPDDWRFWVEDTDTPQPADTPVGDPQPSGDSQPAEDASPPPQPPQAGPPQPSATGRRFAAVAPPQAAGPPPHGGRPAAGWPNHPAAVPPRPRRSSGAWVAGVIGSLLIVVGAFLPFISGPSDIAAPLRAVSALFGVLLLGLSAGTFPRGSRVPCGIIALVFSAAGTLGYVVYATAVETGTGEGFADSDGVGIGAILSALGCLVVVGGSIAALALPLPTADGYRR